MGTPQMDFLKEQVAWDGLLNSPGLKSGERCSCLSHDTSCPVLEIMSLLHWVNKPGYLGRGDQGGSDELWIYLLLNI